MAFAPLPAAEQGRLAKLTAAPLTIELDGQRYEIAPLTLRQWAQLKRFAQGCAIEEISRQELAFAKAGAPEKLVERFRNRAFLAIEHPMESWPADLYEVGLERAFLSLHAVRPQTTREEVERLLDDEVNRARIAAGIAELAAMEARLKNGQRARGGAKAASRQRTPKPSGSPSSRRSPNSTTGCPSKSAT